MIKLFKLLIRYTVFLYTYPTIAQIPDITLEPDGGNKKAWVAEQIGIVKIAISYSRPGVKGREGKIWGTPVAHYGLQDLGHGTSYAVPWRAGANENTTISFSHRVKIEGKELEPGKYGFFIINGPDESTLIFSKNSDSWGSFYYDSTADALQVRVRNKPLAQSVEWLTYEFSDQTENSATIALSGEKRKIPFKVETDRLKLQIESFKKDFQTTRPARDLIQAANFCLANNYDMEQALVWTDRAVNMRIMGERNFSTLSTHAAVLMALDRKKEANDIIQEALPMGNMREVHFFGRTLLSSKQLDEALKVLQYNYDRHPEEYTTNVGMGRFYSARGNYKKALEYMNIALLKAPDTFNKNSVLSMIEKLQTNKDVN
jgi:tetratricopeptide (TPR) repeat protein